MSEVNNAVNSVKIEEKRNPLCEWIPSGFLLSWEKWKEAWEASNVVDTRIKDSYSDFLRGSYVKISLLHHLMTEDNCCIKYPDTIFFLLDLADGHETDKNLMTSDERNSFVKHSIYFWGDRMNNWSVRREVSKKAFAVLCEICFKKNLWYQMFYDDRFFDKIVWFFRKGDFSGNGKIMNCFFTSSSCISEHHQNIVYAFLFDFARLGWEFSGEVMNHFEKKWGFKKEIENKMISLRPHLVRILDGLNKIHWLYGKELDEATVSELEKIVFEQELYLFSKDDEREVFRKPDNLEEAVYGKSKAAIALLIHKNNKQVVENHRRSLNLSRRVERAQRIIEKVSGKMKKINS